MQSKELLSNQYSDIIPYLDKIFYFCLKKTGDAYTAEDLAGEIVYQALVSLSHGCRPISFEAWIWKLARNRYAKFVDRAKRSFIPTAEEDISEYSDFIADRTDIESDYILAEDLRLLRRELAFVRTDYRNVLVAHYIESKSAAVIAKETGMPLGTVKTKLRNGRNRLKEGMNMAREFGTLSYKPEYLNFSISGWSSSDGEPWNSINRLITKNILFETYRNPSTAEELSLELGIALPYMEDELKRLTSVTLLNETDGKYETNFIILSRELQERIYRRLAEITPLLSEKLMELVDRKIQFHKTYCPDGLGGKLSWEDKRWALLNLCADKLEWAAGTELLKKHNLPTSCPAARTERPGNVKWDILGYENFNGKEPRYVSHHSSAPNENGDFFPDFGQYKIQYQNIWNNTPAHLSYNEAEVLYKIAKRAKELDEKEIVLAENIVKYGYAAKENGGYIPSLLVINYASSKQIPGEIFEEYESFSEKVFTEAQVVAMEYINFIWNEIEKEIPLRMTDNTHQLRHAVFSCCNVVGAVLEKAIETGWLRYDRENTAKSIGAYIKI